MQISALSSVSQPRLPAFLTAVFVFISACSPLKSCALTCASQDGSLRDVATFLHPTPAPPSPSPIEFNFFFALVTLRLRLREPTKRPTKPQIPREY